MYEIIFYRSTRGSCSYRSGRGQENYRDETWGLPSRPEARPKELTVKRPACRLAQWTQNLNLAVCGWIKFRTVAFFASIVDGRCEKKKVATSGTLVNQLYGLWSFSFPSLV